MPKIENKDYFLKEENVDIYTLPALDCPEPNSIVVLGDSHGRFTKLMYELFRYCVISNVTSSQYSNLVSIQQKNGDELSKKDLALFISTLNSIVVNLTLRIILIDDFVADRGDADERNYHTYKGGNDYLNLKFLEILSKANVILGICYSNHGVELIDRYERGLNFTESRFKPQHDHFFNTARQLQRLIDRRLVDRATEIDPLIKNHYIAHIKVVIYCRDFLITHAPVGLKQIEQLAKQFNVFYPYDEQSQEFNACYYEKGKLIKTVNAIDAVFKNHSKVGTLHTLHDYYNYNPQNMLDFFTHNRDRKALQRSPCLYQVNGHDLDTEGLDSPTVFTLNAPVGQGRCPQKTCTGIDKVLILSSERQEPQYTDESIREDALWDSIYDIYSSIVHAGANAFITGAALNLFGKFLEKYTRLEQQQINHIKSGLSGILIAYGLWISESEQLQLLAWSLIARYIARAVLRNLPEHNQFVHVAATSTTVGMAVAINSSHTWTSFFSKTIANAASSISAYYGYSLGSTLFSDSTEQLQNIAENAILLEENTALKQENKILTQKLAAKKNIPMEEDARQFKMAL